jgi:protein-tyrosine phosphatase
MIETTNNQTMPQSVSESVLRDERFVDIHCHCLPGIDDGPVNTPEAIELCRALVRDGIGTVIATPHQLGRFDNTNDANQIREAVSTMNEKLQDSAIDLRVLPGADVRVDERLCSLLDMDKVMTLCDGHRYLLLELPVEVLINIEPLLVELGKAGMSVIISHPERYLMVAKRPQIIEKWLEHSVSLQITAGSLLGEFGPATEEAAWSFLQRGQAQFVATDAHDLSERRPCMTAAFERIATRLGPQAAREVCLENPMQILQGADLPNTYQLSITGHRHGGTDN